MLFAEPVCNCGATKIRIYRNNLWLSWGDGGDCDFSFAIAPDSCVEVRTAGVLFQTGLPSDERSPKKTSDYVYDEY